MYAISCSGEKGDSEEGQGEETGEIRLPEETCDNSMKKAEIGSIITLRA